MSRAKVNQAEAVRLYVDEKWTVAELADRYNVNRSRIYAVLKGVERRDDRLKENRTRPTQCGRGLHEFTDENTRVDKAGGWHCRACERDYSMIRYYATRT